jgi:hypothetical protein
MGDPAELDLVRRTVTCRVTGCCEWDDRAARRVRADADLQGFTPEGIKDLLYDFVAHQGGEIHQVEETRPEYSDRPFYYKAIVPVAEFRHGLFVEIVLDDDDPDLPAVRLVNAHEQKR